jgi:hypothetical protein
MRATSRRRTCRRLLRLEHDGAEVLGRAQQRRLGDRGGQLLVGDGGQAADLAAETCTFCADSALVTSVGFSAKEFSFGGRARPASHTGAEHVQVAHAVDAADRVLDARDEVVGDVVLAHAVVGRDEADHHQEGTARLGHAHAGLLHLGRQQRHGQLQLVLHLHLGDVGVGAGREGQRRRRRPVSSLVEARYKQVVDAAHLLLDHLHHGILHRGRRGAGIAGVDLHGRRRDRRELLDRQREDRQAAAEHDQQGEDDREDRPGDEKLRHGIPFLGGNTVLCRLPGAAARDKFSSQLTKKWRRRGAWVLVNTVSVFSKGKGMLI